jgi:NADH-quinone oxidoreductase subunit C
MSEENQNPSEVGPVGQNLQSAHQPFESLGFDAGGVEMLQVAPADLLAVASYLRDRLGFDLLVSVTGVDWKTHRQAVYHLYATETHQWLMLKANADEADHLPSVMPVWPAADWHERETYDLLGIHFDGHPNLTRILMPNDWLGHPLRKDYKEEDPRLIWNRR